MITQDYRASDNVRCWDQAPMPIPIKLNRDGSLVPCIGQVILRILTSHKSTQLSKLLGIVSDIAQCFFQDYSQEIENIESQLHYEITKCEEVMASLEEAIEKDSKQLEEESNKADSILDNQHLVMTLNNELSLIVQRRQRVYPLLEELLLTFETALDSIKLMASLHHPQKPTCYSSTLYYSYPDSLQIEQISNYLVKLKQASYIAERVYGVKPGGESMQDICKQMVLQESQNWLQDLYNVIEAGKFKKRTNEAICFDCKWCEYWGSENEEMIVKREITNEPIAVARERQIQEMEKNFKFLSTMKQCLAVTLHCSNITIQIRILQTSLISRLVLGRCSFSLGGWAILLSLISRMPYLSYLALLACSIDESPRHYARAELLVSLAYSNSLQYLNLGKSIFWQPRFGPQPQMTQEEYQYRHPCNFLTKELAARTTHSFIIHLDLSDQFQSDISGIRDLLQNSKQTSILQRLVLKGNMFSDHGCAHISETLKENTHLLYLDLSRNSITWKGFKTLVQGLELNDTLQFLILDQNKIEYPEKPESTQQVVEAMLLPNQALKMVSLERTPHNFIYKTKRYFQTSLKLET